MRKTVTDVENQVPPFWNLGIVLHEPRVNVLKVVGLAILLEALHQRLESHLDVVPVIQSGIRNDGTVHSKEVDTIQSQLKALKGMNELTSR